MTRPRRLGFAAVCFLTFSAIAVPAGTRSFVSPNEQEYAGFGYSLSGVGDVNGDGRGDLVVGALGETYASLDRAGRAYVLSGSDGAVIHPLFSPSSQQNGQFGSAVSGAPDMNGDGVDDIVVAAEGESPIAGEDTVGRVYTFSGVDGTLFRTIDTPNAATEGSFGRSVSGIPDLNGDGRGDVVVGAYSEPAGTGPDSPGRVYIISGSDAALIRPRVSPNPEELGWFGWTVSDVPDANGDGVPDFAVGAPRESVDVAGNRAGRAYLFSGANGSLLHPLVSPNLETKGGFGWSVSGVPDVNADGRGDLLVGAAGEISGVDGVGTGRAYVFSGSDGTLIRTLLSPNPVAQGGFGSSVSAVPDYDGDGAADFLVGAPSESSISGATTVGRAYVFSGQDGTVLDSLSSLNEEPGSFMGFGSAVSDIPDTDGDGRPDAAVGAPEESPGGSPDYAGRAYIFTSDDPVPHTATPTPTSTPTVTDTPTVTLTPTPGPTNAPPVAVLAYAPQSGPAPLRVHCSGAGFDPDGMLTEQGWSFYPYWVGGSSFVIASATIEYATEHVYETTGVFEITFKVADSDGSIDLATGEVEVWTQVPTETPTATSTPTPTIETPTATPTDTPTVCPTQSALSRADVNGDGIVDERDMIEVMKWWKWLTE